VHDDLRISRPSVVIEDLLRAVEEKIRENRRFTITSLSLHFPEISLSLLHEIVSDKLTFRKFCARCVPKVLMEEHKLKRQASSLDVLTRYIEEGENFLSHVVTGNKTLVSHEAPKSEQQSMECCHTSSPTKTKFKQTTSTQIMCTVFWDRKGVLLVDFLPQDFPINAGVYCDTLKKFCHVIQNKRRGMLSLGVLMIHGNTHPHAAAVTQNLTTTFGWEQFDHPPPHSPDVVPSDFHLFLHLKSFLAGRRFHDDSEVKEAVLCIAGGIILQ
jgi:histone-lysine N-methyltransferase SETMAR